MWTHLKTSTIDICVKKASGAVADKLPAAERFLYAGIQAPLADGDQ